MIYYVLCTIEMFKLSRDFKLQDFSHCLLSLSIDTNTNSGLIHKLKWNYDKKEESIESQA